jgi:hypothetical protein
MKTSLRTKRYTLIVLLIALFLISGYIAYITYQYSIIVRGILGLALMYLLFFFVAYSKIDTSIDALLLAPNKGKYFVFGFIGPIISYWATMQIIEMILFFWKR